MGILSNLYARFRQYDKAMDLLKEMPELKKHIWGDGQSQHSLVYERPC